MVIKEEPWLVLMLWESSCFAWQGQLVCSLKKIILESWYMPVCPPLWNWGRYSSWRQTIRDLSSPSSTQSWSCSDHTKLVSLWQSKAATVLLVSIVLLVITRHKNSWLVKVALATNLLCLHQNCPNNYVTQKQVGGFNWHLNVSNSNNTNNGKLRSV